MALCLSGPSCSFYEGGKDMSFDFLGKTFLAPERGGNEPAVPYFTTTLTYLYVNLLSFSLQPFSINIRSKRNRNFDNPGAILFLISRNTTSKTK